MPKTKPESIKIPAFKFITIAGKGNPQHEFFAEYISALYAVTYAIKMTLKKSETQPKEYTDYTVYPLEGIWDINDEAKKRYNGTLDKNDLVFNLMIRQPDFVGEAFAMEMIELSKKKKPNPLIGQVKFEQMEEGQCVQMMHIGSFDDEPASFKLMEKFAENNNLLRLSKRHREIYLSDFRKVAPEKLKTVLRFKVAAK